MGNCLARVGVGSSVYYVWVHRIATLQNSYCIYIISRIGPCNYACMHVHSPVSTQDVIS